MPMTDMMGSTAAGGEKNPFYLEIEAFGGYHACISSCKPMHI
jgi:hypothetical protein